MAGMAYRRLPAIRVLDDPAKIGYLAGIIDGEGSIGIARMRAPNSKSFGYSTRVVIATTDERLIAWLQDTLGIDIPATRCRAERNPRWKPRLAWYVSGKNAHALLVMVRPYLVIKAEQADIALKMFELSRGKWKGRAIDPNVTLQREALRGWIMKLNRRGVEVPATEIANG
jgi:hypothetical protein